MHALVPHAPDVVLVHDAARPFVPPTHRGRRCWRRCGTHDGAIPAVPVADTLKRVQSGRIVGTVPRDRAVPRADPAGVPLPPAARPARDRRKPRRHRRRRPAGGGRATRFAIVPGADDNIKLTYPEDVVRLERALAPGLLPPHRHRLRRPRRWRPGRPLVLCGITVPHDWGLAGHSDADVGIHALCDAIYTAPLRRGDIGRHFPPSEAEWKDADSARFPGATPPSASPRAAACSAMPTSR